MKVLSALFAALIATTAGTMAVASDYPSKPIMMIVPTKAGGGVDTQARALAAVMEEVLGKPVHIVNKPGAGGTVGLQQLAAARPDGYTLGAAASVSFLQNPITQGLNFGVKNFTIIATTGAFQTAIVAAGNAPFKGWDEFVAYAKANPGTKWYSLGQADAKVMKTIAAKEGINMHIVPGRGGATLAPTLIAGDAHVSFSGGIHSKFLPSGELQVLLSTLGTGKLMATPDVPNSKEKYGVALPNNMTVVAPANLPADILAKLEAAAKTACESDRYAKVMETIQYPVTCINSADSTARYLEQEAADKALLGK